MAKWFLAACCFAAIALSTDLNAWMLPAVFCVLVGFAGAMRNGR